MNIKRLLSIVLAASLAVATLAGCGGASADNTQATVEETPQTEDASANEDDQNEENAGMPNPMVEVYYDTDFADKLGISFDTSYLPSEPRMFNIADEMADIRFFATDGDGIQLDCALRGTKNDEYADNPVELIAGIYSTQPLKFSKVDYDTDEGTIEINNTIIESEDETDYWDVSYWDLGGVHYTLSINGDLGETIWGEVMDSIMLTIGATSFKGNLVQPYTYDIDSENMSDGIYPATLYNIRKEDGGIFADFTIYNLDLYDALEINMLSPGDTLIVEGEELEVTSVEDGKPVDFHDGEGERDVKIVNGGIEAGGAEFIANEGGTYRFFGMDDYATYTEVGYAGLEISKDAVINDTSNLDHPDGIKLSAEELYELFTSGNDIGFNYLNSNIRVEDGKVVEINRWFTP